MQKGNEVFGAWWLNVQAGSTYEADIRKLALESYASGNIGGAWNNDFTPEQAKNQREVTFNWLVTCLQDAVEGWAMPASTIEQVKGLGKVVNPSYNRVHSLARSLVATIRLSNGLKPKESTVQPKTRDEIVRGIKDDALNTGKSTAEAIALLRDAIAMLEAVGAPPPREEKKAKRAKKASAPAVDVAPAVEVPPAS